MGTPAYELSGFLNDLVAQLWPNINVAGCKMIKDIVEPILASTLPGPLKNLKFIKIDLGDVPVRYAPARSRYVLDIRYLVSDPPFMIQLTFTRAYRFIYLR